MTAIYTAISQLPIHYTKPYNWGSEKVVFAVTKDGGKSWQRDETSVILASPPDEYKDEIVAWRDPYIAAWPEMDVQLGLVDQLYCMISGGLKDKTPTAFLYRVNREDIRKWTYVSKVADVGLNMRLSKYSGDMGRNWEVCNFFTLEDWHFFIMNVEGVDSIPRARHAMWAKVELNGSQLTPMKSGKIDHGTLYAATTFVHGPTQRRLLWGWITEDDLAESRYDQQGWSGCMSLPREMFLLTYNGVDKSAAADEELKHVFEMQEEEGKQSLRIQTLGSRPAVETLALRKGAEHFIAQTSNPGPLPIQSKSVELDLEIAINADIKDNKAEIGLMICHNVSHSRYTKIIYSGDAIHVIRSKSSKDPDVKTTDLIAPLKLLHFADGTLEKVNMRIFVDNSVLEIFVNERVAFATRVYCDLDDCDSVSLVNEEPTAASFERVEAWIGLQPAMIDAPIDILEALKV